MSENVKDEKKSFKTVIILLIILIILLLAAGIGITMYFVKKTAAPENADNGGLIQYQEGVVALEDAQAVYDKLSEEAAKNNVAVSYARNAYSDDGVNFACDIDNSSANLYDMYFNIYKDDSLSEQILLTGLIPPGSGIREFKSEIPLDPGVYNAVLVFTQVEDDHSTIHNQAMVVLELSVRQ